MKKRRDDHAHNRGPSSQGELQLALASSKEELSTIFRSLSFLARYPLRCVDDVDYDELERVRMVVFRDLVGDHPVVPRRRVQVAEEVGCGLHVVDQFGRLRLAAPWMVYEECPQCGHHEVCIPEYGSPKDHVSRGVSFKSLTTGHVHHGRERSAQRLAKFVGVTV